MTLFDMELPTLQARPAGKNQIWVDMTASEYLPILEKYWDKETALEYLKENSQIHTPTHKFRYANQSS